MVEINLPNAVTIGLIAVIALVFIRFVAKAANKESPV
jgi:type IV secretory pathway VirB6-like protein